MSTVYSNEYFKIETEKDDLRFRKVFGTMMDVDMVFDNQLNIVPEPGFTILPEPNTSGCFVGGGFKKNHVGLLSQVKYFLGEVGSKHIYINQMKF